MKRDTYQFYYFAAIHILALSLLLAGCATQTKSIALGGTIGAGTGAVIGGIADPGKHGEFRTRNIILGSAIGGMAGMISASAVHENTEEKKHEAYLQGQASAKSDKSQNMPNLRQPKVDARWIEGKIVGNRYIEAHWEYLIVEPAHWEDSQ